MLREDEIAWTLRTAPWRSHRPVLDLAIEALPVIADDIAADLVEQLCLTVVNLSEELNGVRQVLSAALAHMHAADGENVRLRGRLVEMSRASRPRR